MALNLKKLLVLNCADKCSKAGSSQASCNKVAAAAATQHQAAGAVMGLKDSFTIPAIRPPLTAPGVVACRLNMVILDYRQLDKEQAQGTSGICKYAGRN